MTKRSDLHALPLRPAVYHILLVLSARELHGLGIAEEIEEASDGVLELGPGTLYRSLSEMTADGLIEPVPAPSDDADPRRKYYRITKPGRALVARESARLARLVEVARARRILPEGA